jgi:tetratricopeptide (TPR) repeat protein
MEVALLLGDEEEAQRAFGELLPHVTTDRARAGAWNSLAAAYNSIDHAVKELEYRKKAAEFVDTGKRDLAMAHRRLGQLEEAEKLLREVAGEESDIERGSKKELFDVLRDQGKAEEALRHARRWREVRPADQQSHVAVIETHLIAGREADADRAFREGLDFFRRPENKAVFLVRASASYFNYGRFERAEELVRQALSLGSSAEIEWYWGFLVGQLMAQQKYAEAEDTLERIRSLRAGSLAPWQQRQEVRLALGRGDADAGARLALQHLSRRPLMRADLMLAARALAAAERFAEAEPHARKAFSMNPENGAHRLLAWILIAGDIDIDEGLALAEKARTLHTHWSVPAILAANPWQPSIEHSLGLGYLKQGRRAEAIPLLEKAAALQPRRTLIQEHLQQARR